jgi:beta-lactamase regulating signal transducer with metallopeptidase domain
MNPELEPLCHRILSALLNGGYQGLLLTGFVWLGLKFLPNTNASTRHAVGLATLLVVAVLPLIHFLATAAPTPAMVASLSARRALLDADSDIRLRQLILASGESTLSRIRMTPILPPATARDDHDVQRSLRQNPERIDPDGEATAVAEPVISVKPLESRSFGTRVHWQTVVPERVAMGLIGLWAVIGAVRLGGLIGECRFLRALKRRGNAPPTSLNTSFEALRREMQVHRRPRLLVVPGPAAPMAVGYLNPAVLLPASLCPETGGDTLDQILRHELAHVRRGDDWSNLVQQVVKTTLFFHPAVWWLSRRLTLDREIACDDHVLAATRTPRDYALFLTEFAGKIQYRNCSAAPAGWSRKSQLKERITMILDSNRNSSTRLAKLRVGTLTAAAALLAYLSLHAAPRLELAQASPDEAGSASASAGLTESNTSSEDASTITVSGGNLRLTPSASTSTVSVRGDNLHVIHSDGGAKVVLKSAHGRSTGSGTILADARPKPQPVPKPQAVPQPHPVPQPRPVIAVPPIAPVPPHALHPDAIPAAPGPFAAVTPSAVSEPAPPSVPWRKSRLDERSAGSESIEKRIERLEALIESLLERGELHRGGEGGKKDAADGKPGKAGPELSWDLNPAIAGELAKARDWAKLNAPEFAEMARQAQQEAQRASREAARVVEEARRAAVHAFRQEERKVRSTHPDRSVESQRHHLESQRHALERQLDHVSEQIARLEQEREKLEAQMAERANRLEEIDVDVDIDLELELEHEHDHDIEHERDSDDSESDEMTREGAAAEAPVKRRF